MVVFELVVGILSMILALFAIWLSIKLYQMSNSAMEKIHEAEKSIKENVEQLDRLFGLLYSDTWTLVRDSYTSMQERLWEQRREHAGASREPDQETTPAAPAPDHEETAIAGGNPLLEDFLVAEYRRMSRAGGVVRVADLAHASEREGYAAMVALNTLYELVFVRRRLFLHGEGFTPLAIVAESREQVEEAAARKAAGSPQNRSDY